MKNIPEDLIHILKEKSPLAGQLADYEILELIQLMPLHSYRENETILAKGEPASSLMFLISGSVNIHLNDLIFSQNCLHRFPSKIKISNFVHVWVSF